MPDMIGQKIILVVIVYNRLANLKRWLRCWHFVDRYGAKMVVIHNCDDGVDNSEYQNACIEANEKYKNIQYIKRRNNRGRDVGAIQDVFTEKLPGFDNDWDVLLWVTDDVFPMRHDFIRVFVDTLDGPGVGLSCMEISLENIKHVRTNNFCIKKYVSKRIRFPEGRICNKRQCYEFEHIGSNTLFKQILRMKLHPVQVSQNVSEYLWDTGHRYYLRTIEEHMAIFPNQDGILDIPDIHPQGNYINGIHSHRVLFISLIYNTHPYIIYSLLAQTDPNWELLLIHDGPPTIDIKSTIDHVNDSRITYLQTEERKGRYGHPWRSWAIERLREEEMFKDCNYVVITNSDNYYVPSFCEYMIRHFNNNMNAVAVYCNKMVHSYNGWDAMPCKPERGYIDAGGVMVRKDVACAIGWNDTQSHSADWVYFNEILEEYGKDRFIPTNGCLFVHN
jgi:hypothetical protein